MNPETPGPHASEEPSAPLPRRPVGRRRNPSGSARGTLRGSGVRLGLHAARSLNSVPCFGGVEDEARRVRLRPASFAYLRGLMGLERCP